MHTIHTTCIPYIHTPHTHTTHIHTSHTHILHTYSMQHTHTNPPLPQRSQQRSGLHSLQNVSVAVSHGAVAKSTTNVADHERLRFDLLEKEMAIRSVCLPGKYHGQRKLTGLKSVGVPESDTSPHAGTAVKAFMSWNWAVALIVQLRWTAGTHPRRPAAAPACTSRAGVCGP